MVGLAIISLVVFSQLTSSEDLTQLEVQPRARVVMPRELTFAIVWHQRRYIRHLVTSCHPTLCLGCRLHRLPRFNQLALGTVRMRSTETVASMTPRRGRAAPDHRYSTSGLVPGQLAAALDIIAGKLSAGSPGRQMHVVSDVAAWNARSPSLSRVRHAPSPQSGTTRHRPRRSGPERPLARRRLRHSGFQPY